MIKEKTIIYRSAVKNDIPEIRTIFGYYILNTTATWRYEVPDLNWMYDWYDQHQKDNKPVWVACLNDQVIGYASLSAFRAGEGYWPCAENSVYLKPEFCGQGIGRKLMTIIIDQAGNTNIRFIIAGIDNDNAGSIKFHESFGFKSNSIIRQIGNKFERNLDLNLMVLDLNYSN